MHFGAKLLQTWIPNGGFKIERRKLKTPDGGSAVADCLVPKWTDDELTPDRPCARQPCLHRLSPSVRTRSRPNRSSSGKKEIAALHTCADLWAAGSRDRLARKLAEHLIRVPFHLRPSEENPLAFRYCPTKLSAAL
jgi:hypothetical protein